MLEAPLRPGETVCDIRCDSGVLEPLLRRSAASRLDLHVATVDAQTLPLPDASCDLVVSLFALGFAPQLLSEARRVRRPTGRIALLTWRAADPPPHEVVLRDALRDATSSTSPFLQRVLAAPGEGERILSDVVRFDGFTQYWTALVDERPLREELMQLPDSMRTAVRDWCRRELARFEMPDGTLRIPVRAAVIDG